MKMKNIVCFFSIIYFFFTSGVLVGQESDCAAVVNNAPNINQGEVQGSIQQLKPKHINLNSGAVITGDLLVPGTPNVNVNGSSDGFGGVTDGTGSVNPSNYGINVNNPVQVRSIIRRTDPIAMPVANAADQPQGNQWINLNQPGDEPADFSNVRGINVNNGYGDLTLPVGAYQNVNVNGGHNLILGNAGATEAAVYSVENLSLNQNSDLIVLGPVELRLKNSFNIHGVIGNEAHPEWLTVHLQNGGMNLNTSSTFIGTLIAPNGTVHINNNAILKGQVFVDRLTVNSEGKLICALGGGAPANEAPVAQDGSAETQEDAAVAITLVGTDPENSPLSYTIVTQPSNGALSGTAPNLTYTPDTGFDGADQFAFTVNDGELTSEPATFSLTVNPVNHPPTANNFTVELNEDEVAVAVAFQGTDTDGDALTYTVLTQPSNGTLAGTGQNLSYTPTADYNGPDSFTYKVNDGEFDSVIATVSIQVNAVNDAPTSSDQAFETNEDTALTFTLAAEDIDNSVEDFVFTIIDQPSNGTLEIPGNAGVGEYVYTPSANFNGEDTFTFTVGDGELTTEVFTATITILSINDAPVATAGTLTVEEDGAGTFVPTGSDVDGDNLIFQIVTQPTNGAAAVNSDGTFTYTSGANYNGADSFTYLATDGLLNSVSVEVSITVTPVNDTPLANDLAVAFDEDTNATLIPTGSDIDNDSLSFQIVTQPTSGAAISNSDGTFTYTPNENYNGSDSFTYIANDGTIDSASATASLTIDPVNDAPVALSESVVVNQGELIDIQLKATDIDEDSLSFSIVTQPVNGTLTEQSNSLYQYQSSVNYSGLDTFVFSVTDGELTSEAVVQISVKDGLETIIVAPSVQFEFVEGQVVPIRAQSEDKDNVVVETAIYLNDQKVVTSVGKTAELNSDDLSVGTHRIYSLAINDAGESAQSEEIEISVRAQNKAPTVDAGSDKIIELTTTVAEELVINGGNEELLVGNLIEGWTIESGSWDRVISDGSFQALEGQASFATSAQGVSQLSQTIDLVAFADSIDSQTQFFQFQASLRMLDLAGEGASVVLEYLAEDGSSLVSKVFEPVLSEDRWTRVSEVELAPQGARQVRISLIGDIAIADGQKAFFVDAVSLRALTYPSAFLTGIAQDDGLPENSQLSYEWKQLSGPSLGIVSPTEKVTALNVSQLGNYEFELTVSDSEFSASDTVLVEVVAPTGNQAPKVTNIDLDFGIDAATLTAFPEDDGLPLGSTLSSNWFQLDGPAPADIVTQNDTILTVCFRESGFYSFRFVVSDGEFLVQEDVTLELSCSDDPGFGNPNRVPVVEASIVGGQRVIKLDEDNTVRLSGNAQDDGLPNNMLTNQWLQLSGPQSTTLTPDGDFLDVVFTEPGVYRFQFTSSDGELTGIDEVSLAVVLNNSAPTIQGSDILTVTTPTVQTDFVVEDDGQAFVEPVMRWLQVAGPSAQISNVSIAAPEIFLSEFGSYEFQLVVSDGEFEVFKPLIINYVSSQGNGGGNLPPEILLQSEYTSFTSDLQLQPEVSDDGQPTNTLTYDWSFVEGPGNLTFATPQAQQTAVTVDATGEYLVEFRVSDGVYVAAAQTRLRFLEIDPVINRPPMITLSEQLNVVLPDTLALTPTVTDPENDALSFSWQAQGQNAAAVSFANAQALQTTASFQAEGLYQLELVASDGNLTSTATSFVRVVNNEPPQIVLESPIIYQGIQTPVDLVATIEDDGLSGFPLETTWSLVTGPGTALFADDSLPTTSVTLSETGDYILQINVSDGRFTAFRQVLLRYVDPAENLPPVVEAGAEQTVEGVSEFTLMGTVTDNTIPEGGQLTTEWRVLYEPGTDVVEIVNPASLTTTVRSNVPGTFVFGLFASDGEFDVADQVVVRTLGSGNTILVSPRDGEVFDDSAYLSLSADVLSFDGVVEKVEFFAQQQGATPVSLGQGITTPGSVTWNLQVPALEPGEYAITAVSTKSTGEEEISLAANITVSDFNENTLSLDISSPEEGGVVTEPTDIIGSVISNALSFYELQYRSSDSSDWITINRGTVPVSDASLGVFDPTLLENGTYELQILAETTFGVSGTFGPVPINIDSNVKLGHFTLAFEDLSVPVTGIPITVTRTYDSRDQKKGDFGIGWNLGFDDIKVRKNRDFGDSWRQSSFIQGGVVAVSAFCLEPIGNREVTLTFGDGRTEIFEVSTIAYGGAKSFFGTRAPDNCTFLAPISEAEFTFTPKASRNGKVTRGSLELVNNERFAVFTGTGDFDLPFFNEPQLFRYTDEAGNVYIIDTEEGVQSITDLNGNTITITDNGITHSAGEDVQFIRNAKGCITEIIDPSGERLTYAYDTQDRLISFTNRVGDITRFLYENATFPNYLTCIEDPRGVEAIRTEYDDDGRMIRQIDSDGNAINFEYQIANNTQIIRDRLGNATIYQYDENGNITFMTDALGGITRYTHDENDNETSTSTPLGFITTRLFDQYNSQLEERDPLGNVTSYTYSVDPNSTLFGISNSQVNPLSITDPLGNVTGFAYNGPNLSQMTDAVNADTGFAYDGSGNLNSLTDAVGTTTTYTHDSKGRELTMTVTDADGNTMRSESYTYDANGNRLTSATTRTLANGTVETLTTSFVYDAENRVTQTTYPDNSTTSTVYNSIGKEASTTDQLGRVTSYAYDARGNRILTTYPDNSTMSMTYDVENRQTSITNQLGETTYMIYDALGRQTATIYPDATMPLTTLVEVVDIEAAVELADNPRSVTEYDADSRVIATIDTLGNRTEFEYDDAGRRILVRDALMQETHTEYDAAGRQIAAIDAKGNRTEFEYDAANRLVRTIFADDTFTTVDYDALGRRTRIVDQEGNATNFEYDALGRLVAVIDPLNQRTEYDYDEQGSQLVQRDALGRETRYSYDQLGRRIGRTLPEGQSESVGYDLVGNMTSRTDFNGHVTTYVHDIMNRVTSMTADATHPSLALNHAPQSFSYGYDLLGRRTSAEALNTSNERLFLDEWVYDVRGRLTTHGTSHGTLGYSYDDNSNLLTAQSDADNGYKQGYQYDVLNRLSGLLEEDAADPAQWQSVSGYSYDFNGNLESVSYKNAVAHIYNYDFRNRLTNLSVGRQAVSTGGIETALQGYTYTLNKAGHRTQITELSGRTITNVFDKLYRLTSESIAGSLAGVNGATTYSYDAVGNRNTRTSTVSALSNQSYTYSNNDWLNGDTYDSNGNTTQSQDPLTAGNQQPTTNVGDVYDFRNKLIRRTRGDNTQIDLTYDTDGNRVRKSVYLPSGALDKDRLYLVDRNNHTGYAQVVEEMDENGNLVSKYLYGHDLVAMDSYLTTDNQQLTTPVRNYYQYDGLGSVRALSNENGEVTEEYDYDAYGILIEYRKLNATTGALESLPTETFALQTSNNYLFTGEQYDSDLGMYYLRARYLNTQTGRFHTLDTYEGRTNEPQTLHKYLYAHSNPASFIDPSGNLSLSELGVSIRTQLNLQRFNFRYSAGIAAGAFNSLVQARLVVIGIPLVKELEKLAANINPYNPQGASSIRNSAQQLNKAVSEPAVLFNTLLPAFLATLPGSAGAISSLSLSIYRMYALNRLIEDIVAKAAEGASFSNQFGYYNFRGNVHPIRNGVRTFGVFGLFGTGRTPANDLLPLNYGLNALANGNVSNGAYWLNEFHFGIKDYKLDASGNFGGASSGADFAFAIYDGRYSVKSRNF